MALSVFTKQVGELRTLEFIFANFPEILGGDNLSVVKATTATPQNGLGFGTAFISGTSVFVSISGGISSRASILTCLVQTGSGSLLAVEGQCQIFA